MKSPELIEQLSGLPQDKPILCQVVDQVGNVFNCEFELNDVADSWMIQLRVSHKELHDFYNLKKNGDIIDPMMTEMSLVMQSFGTTLAQLDPNSFSMILSQPFECDGIWVWDIVFRGRYASVFYFPSKKTYGYCSQSAGPSSNFSSAATSCDGYSQSNQTVLMEVMKFLALK